MAAATGCAVRLCRAACCMTPVQLESTCISWQHLHLFKPPTQVRCGCVQWSVRCRCASSTRSRRCVPSAASRSKAFTSWHDTCWQGTGLCHTEAQGYRMLVLL